MSRRAIVLTIFVASPSDVKEEREVLEKVVAEFNRAWSGSLGIIFDLVKWETNVHPAFGNDPQSIINDQIGENYDIFIGILWARFGTPTPRYHSGTQEEFEKSIKILHSGKKSFEIMLYFKDMPISPSAIEANELKLVQEFKKSISDRGGIYSEFTHASAFHDSVRVHLSMIAHKFSAALISQDSKSIISIMHDAEVANKSVVESGELGFFDYVNDFEVNMACAGAAIVEIGAVTNELNNKFAKNTQLAKDASGYSGDGGRIRSLIDSAAADMNSFSDKLEPEISTLASSREKAFAALANALIIYAEFSETAPIDRFNLRSQLAIFADTAQEATKLLDSFRLTIGSVPRLTKDINKAKRRMIEIIDFLMVEFSTIAQSVTNIIETLDKME